MTDQTPSRLRRPVYIVDGSRTPFLKVKGRPGPFTASDLAVQAGRALLARQPFEASTFDEVIVGCMMPGPDEANVARVIALRLGCGKTVPAWTVQRNCASGLQALDCAADDISNSRSELVLAGGVESMSHAPVLFNHDMVGWLADLNAAKTFGAKLGVFSKLRLKHLSPVIGLLRGLTDHTVGLSMGQTAEILAQRFNVTREDMDQYAMESHQRLAHAQDSGYLNEIATLYDTAGNHYSADDGLRRDTDMPRLAKLKPVFDRPFGKVTAGNSAQVTDGAAMLILASEAAVKKHHLKPLGRIIDSQWAGLDPAQMGLGPAHAMAPILQRQKLAVSDVDYWEINEAFATQVLACVRAWQDAAYCRTELAFNDAIGKIPRERLNVDGGGVSLGHPVGASGARVVLHLLNVLKRNNAKRGIASLCIGGGQGGAMLIETV
ncbi:MAG: acetyl-CoA C-acetyltransferase [Gammaproteobacteria bacterium]|nr:acetyl-CoA C-acetyltransferase [Gammaproteobacteria bacterium]